jgi:hypothetical protein
MKPFEIQSPALSINGVLIDTSAQGKLVIPGVTRAGTSVAIEVDDTEDQTATWTGTPVVIDGYTYYTIIQGNSPINGWTAATYAIAELDDDGYIDGIDVVTGGAGYTGEAVTYSTVMFAAPEGTQIDPSTSGDWTEIPFKVRCGAGEIESEFNGGGSSALEGLDDVQLDGPSNGQVLTWNSSQEKWENQDPSGGGGNANTGDLSFEGNTVYADGTGFLNLQNGEGYVVIGSNNNSPLKVSVNENGGAKEWLFDPSGNLTLPEGGDIIDAYGSSVLGGGSTSIIGTGSFSTLPDFLDYEPGTLAHAGQTSQGVFFSGDAGENNISYPVRTNFSISGTTKVTVTVDMEINSEQSDFGLCVFEQGTQPQWHWEDSNSTRIAVQYNWFTPEISAPNNFTSTGWNIPGPGTYRVRFTYDPNNSPNIMLETMDTSDIVLDTLTLDETLNTNNDYYIGFGADQDIGALRTYIKNLNIAVDGQNSVSDSLRLGGNATALYTQNAGSVTGQQDNVAQGRYNIVIDAEKDVVINTDEDTYQFRFTNKGELKFPDGTKQQTAYVQRNINLDGGGAMAHYDIEVDVAFADGGFSSTRHGVADASFDGGNRLTEVNQYNLDGGGA